MKSFTPYLSLLINLRIQPGWHKHRLSMGSALIT
uniref:Uncharacterized protein n=1 Tax=Anguilla anguilla TaxID=7936 RepID=A0A0E9XYF0_ANGAN